MELCPKEVQKSPKERVRRQRKPTVDMGGQENALTLLRLRLGLLPREPCRSMGDQSSVGQVERIQSPWIQPGGRPTLDEDPLRLVALPFAFAVAFFARSRAAIFSFTIIAGETRTEQRR